MVIVQPDLNTSPKIISFATTLRRDYACQSVIELPQLSEVSYCELERGAGSGEKIFAQLADDAIDYDKNDVSTFLQSVQFGDVVVYRLLKNSVVVSGDCSDVGTTNNWTNTQNLFGLQLEWKKVLKIYGIGKYQVEILIGDGTDEGSEKRWSNLFNLSEFDPIDADGTFVIESVSTGRITNGFDFTQITAPNYWDLPFTSGFYWRYRVVGSFGKRKPKLTKIEYQNSEHKNTQIQDKIQYEYTMQTYLIYWYLVQRLIEATVHNAIYFTDYNLYNSELAELKRLNVAVLDFGDLQHFKDNRKNALNVRFTDRYNNTIKRNYF